MVSTAYVSSTHLTADIPSTDVSSGEAVQVTVFNPSPGGGTSSAATFDVNFPVPVLSTISPTNTQAGGADFTLTVDGSNFSSSSVVRWNGTDLTTTFVNSTQLTAAVPASDIVGAGSPVVTVFNPSPGGGSSVPQLFFVYLSLQANDLIYDPFGKKIYASLPSTAGGNGNSLLPIDPLAGTSGTAVLIGSEPGKLAISDDGQFIYVSLDGAAAIRRFIISSQTPDIQFTLGTYFYNGAPLYAEDMQVLPGSPRSLAVSKKVLGFSPRSQGVAVYDDAVQRPTTANSIINVIAFSKSAATLYGLNIETSDLSFYTMAVDPTGVTVTSTAGGSSLGYDMKFDNGRIYGISGAVFDPVDVTLLGQFKLTGPTFSVAPDSTVGRAFFLAQPDFSVSAYAVLAFDTNKFTPVGLVSVPGVSGTPGSLIRWGANGLFS